MAWHTDFKRQRASASTSHTQARGLQGTGYAFSLNSTPDTCWLSLIPNVASQNPFMTQSHRPKCRLPLKYSKRRARGNRKGRIKRHQKRDWTPWLPCTWMKDWFLAFADDVVVQAAHEQGIPELLIYYVFPASTNIKATFGDFLFLHT